MGKVLTRDFILNFFLQFVFSSVFCILIPAIPIYLTRFGAREGDIGILIGVVSVSSLILRPFVGRALVTIPEKNFMIAGTVLYVVSCLAYLAAPPFWPLFIVRVVQGIGLAFFSTASFTMLANTLPEANRGRLISYFYLSYNLSFALGPYFGMLLINHFNFSVLFWVCTALSLSSLYLTLKLGRPQPVFVRNEFRKAQSLFSREALPPSIMAFVMNFIWTSLCAFFPLYALQHGVSNPGTFFIFLAITLMLGRVLGGRILDVYSREKIIIPCLSIIIVGITVLSLSHTISMFILAAVILGTGWAFVYPSLTVHVIENAGIARGPAMATFTGLGDLGAGIGPMFMGLVLEKTSYPVMFSCLILAGIINFFYFYFAILRKARNPAAEGFTKEGVS